MMSVQLMRYKELLLSFGEFIASLDHELWQEEVFIHYQQHQYLQRHPQQPRLERILRRQQPRPPFPFHAQPPSPFPSSSGLSWPSCPSSSAASPSCPSCGACAFV